MGRKICSYTFSIIFIHRHASRCIVINTNSPVIRGMASETTYIKTIAIRKLYGNLSCLGSKVFVLGRFIWPTVLAKACNDPSKKKEKGKKKKEKNESTRKEEKKVRQRKRQ